MPTIYRANNDRISVADAKRFICEAVPREPAYEVYAQVDENGNANFNGPFKVRKKLDANIHSNWIDIDFLDACKQCGIEPRLKYRPTITDYTGGSMQDATYTIAHDEFVRYAELFSLNVAIGNAPEQADNKPQAAPALPADTKPAPAAAAAGAGAATVWTPERKAQARAMLNKLRSEGVRAFARRTADAFNVSPTRLNMVLGEKIPKEKPKKKASFWPT